MKSYFCYFRAGGRPVQGFEVVQGADDGAARKLAAVLLKRHPMRERVEVWESAKRICTVTQREVRAF